jgi:CheY-like chemotaxis protein
MSMKKLLVIDDEPDITEIISLFAEQLGYPADICSSGHEAIGKVKGSDYWAVFCDLKMPGLNGLECFDAIEKSGSDLRKRFILMTGAILDKGTESAAAKKNIFIFKKPFNFEEIRALFARLEEIQ